MPLSTGSFQNFFIIPVSPLIPSLIFTFQSIIWEKKECWESLSDFLELNSLANIIIAGDLNITLAPNEKKGGLRGKDHMQDTMEDLIQV